MAGAAEEVELEARVIDDPPWEDGESTALSRSRWRRVDALFLYLPFAFAVAMTFASSPDDTLITLRYAYNLLHGHGLVYNPGQYVNGATSPAGVVLAVVALLIPGGYALFKVKILSLVFALLTVAAGRRLLDALDFERPVYLAGLVILGLSSPIAFAAASGLETTTASFAVAGLVLEVTTGRAFRRPAWAAGAAALAVAARPEAIALVIFIAAVALIRESGYPLSGRVGFAAGGAAMELFLVVANQLYYGSPVPNTFWAKQGPMGSGVRPGLRYLAHALDPGYPARPAPVHSVEHLCVVGLDLLIVLGALVVVARWRSGLYVLAPVLAQCLFVLDSGGDWMGGGRFVEPVAPELVALMLFGVSAFVPIEGLRWRPAALTPLALCALGATAFTYASPARRDPITALSHGMDTRDLIAHGGFESFSLVWADQPQLLACAPSGSLVADTEGGYSGFADERLRILDLRGLTDRTIATTAPRYMRGYVGVVDVNWWRPGSTDGRVILKDRPVLVVTLEKGGGPVVLDGHYRLVGRPKLGGAHEYVYERSDMHCPAPRVKSRWG